MSYRQLLSCATVAGCALVSFRGFCERPADALRTGGDVEQVYCNARAYEGDVKPLRRLFMCAEAGGEVRIAVIGGSITEGARASRCEKRWSDVFVAGWRNLFPKAKIVLKNVGIGSTGSEIGCYRYSRDVSPFKPDLVVFEYGVNDGNVGRSTLTMAGLLRHAAREGAASLVLAMAREDGRDAQDAHLAAAREYHVPVISYRDAIRPKLESGEWKWRDLAADSVHPNDRGHALAAGLLNMYVRDEYRRFDAERDDRPFLPSPAEIRSFEGGKIIPFSQVKLDSCDGFVPYDERRWGTGLVATNKGARISFAFEGGTAGILYRKGKLPHGRIRVIVDGAELPEDVDGFADNEWWWTPQKPLFVGRPGRHTVVIETIGRKGGKGTGDGFRLAALLVAP